MNLPSGCLTEKSAVVFIEFQNEWVCETGILRKKFIKPDININTRIDNAKSLLTQSRLSNALICHVTMQPDPQYKTFGLATYGLRAAIPKAKTWQGKFKQIHEMFKPLTNEVTIYERTGASAFSGSMLDSVLRNNKIETLYLAGFATHVCVESTLRDAHDKGYTCYVVNDATAAFNLTQQNYFETNIVHHFGHCILSRDVY